VAELEGWYEIQATSEIGPTMSRNKVVAMISGKI
jgi:hypothetical protein